MSILCPLSLAGFWRRVAPCALLCLGALPAWAKGPIAVQLSWHHQFQFAGYYLAKERGHYAAEGLEVEIRSGGPSSPRPVEAVTSGRAQFGVANAGLAVERMNGTPVVALAAVLQSSPAVWIAPGRHDPLDWARWLGTPRAIPFRPADSTELLIPFMRLAQKEQAAQGARAVQAAQPDSAPRPQDASPVPGPAAAATGPALRAAYLSHEVREAAAEGLAHTVLNPRDMGVDFYSDVLFTSEAYLADRPGTVARFRAATLRGWADAFNDVEGTARLIQRLYAPSVPLQALIHEGQVLRRLARPEQVELGHMSRARWQAIAQLQHEHGFGLQRLDTDAFVRPEPAIGPALAPDPVRITLVGVVVALLFGGFQLLRINSRLLRANQALADSGRTQEAEGLRFQFLMDVAPFPIAIYALQDGRVLYANDRALAWSGAADMTGRPIHDWLPALAPGQGLAARLQGGRTLREQEVELPPAADGASRWCAVTGRAIEYDGSHCAFIAFSDISDRKTAERDLALLSEQRALILRDVEKLQQRLRDASLHDALTGLHNRRYFEGTAPREFARCRRDKLPLGLLVIDADHFKKVNDTHGHTGGDEVLKALGQVLVRSFRTEDLVCRFGGEEFVVLMPGSDAASTLARAEALREAVAACEVLITAGVVRFTVSVGAAVGDADTETPQSLFDRADRAVYAAKAAGRNCVRLASPAAEPATA